MNPSPKAFVVGHPVAHSRSPLIHGFWLRQHGLAGAYERADVAPAAFPDFLRGFPGQGFVGGNVTVPHKEAAFRLCRRSSALARRLEAVNTLWLEDKLLCGDNTDVIGFMAHLDQTLGAEWEAGVATALVLGAGGAARAIVAGLLDRGLPAILVANRTAGRADELAGFDADRVQGLSWNLAGKAMPQVGLVVNTTSLGMAGQPPLALDLAGLPGDAIVADIVYVPLETPLLAAARSRGLRTVDGLGMLLHQAVPGFARWFGVTPAVTPDLRALVVADIEARP